MTPPDPQVRIVLITAPNADVAAEIARALVAERLAACVNVVPGVESTFWWEGKVDRAREVLLVIKTTAARFGALKRAVLVVHPYEVPEVIGLPLAVGHRAYLAWIAASVSGR